MNLTNTFTCISVCGFRENGLEDKITLIKGRMEDVDLPVEQVGFNVTIVSHNSY